MHHDAALASAVRRDIADELTAQHLDRDSIDDVLLVVGELICNAIRHVTADDDLDVSWDVESECVLVRVGDGSSELPRLMEPDLTATSGRGMRIVAALSREWGVDARTPGKQVWARVPVQRAG